MVRHNDRNEACSTTSRRIPALLALGLVTATGLVALGAQTPSASAGFPLCAPGFPPLHFDISTGATGGAPDAFGTADGDWSMLSSPGAGAGSAYSIAAHTTWATLGGANWINPYGDMTQTFVYFPGNNAMTAPGGTYEYALEFFLPCLPRDCEDLILAFEYSADDVVEFRLNGVFVGSATAYGVWLTTDVIEHRCDGFLLGPNQLTATVENSGLLWTGLLLDGEVVLLP